MSTVADTLKVRWKVTTCNSGESCWCRVIEPETELLDNEGSALWVIGDGSVDKLTADHIVKLHNDSLGDI